MSKMKCKHHQLHFDFLNTDSKKISTWVSLIKRNDLHGKARGHQQEVSLADGKFMTTHNNKRKRNGIDEEDNESSNDDK